MKSWFAVSVIYANHLSEFLGTCSAPRLLQLLLARARLASSEVYNMDFKFLYDYICFPTPVEDEEDSERGLSVVRSKTAPYAAGLEAILS